MLRRWAIASAILWWLAPACRDVGIEGASDGAPIAALSLTGGLTGCGGRAPQGWSLPQGVAERAATVGAGAWEEYQRDRGRWIDELAQTVAACTERQDTRHAVFHGCIDWHSAVHGHYALVAAYRVTQREQYRRIVDESLTASGIAAEDRYLTGRPNFEMPYGRAWLLRLALEDAEATGSPRLRAMAQHVARSLQEHYAKVSPRPGTREYRNDSWALRQLHDWCQAAKDLGCLTMVRNAVAGHFLAPAADVRVATDRSLQPDFFSPWGNWAHLLAATVSKEQFVAWLHTQPPLRPEERPIVRWYTAHHLGMDFSRAWGFWSVYEATGDGHYRDVALAHVRVGMALHAARKNEYWAYGHWVPQFGIYAMSAMRD